MAKPKYRAGQFISTPFGRMRVRIATEYPPCNKCALSEKSAEKCKKFKRMHDLACVKIIGWYCYLEKI